MTRTGPDRALTAFNAVPDMTCAHCQSAFEPKPRGHGRRFCSSRCRSQWHVARRERLLADLAETLDQAAALIRELREAE